MNEKSSYKFCFSFVFFFHLFFFFFFSFVFFFFICFFFFLSFFFFFHFFFILFSYWCIGMDIWLATWLNMNDEPYQVVLVFHVLHIYDELEQSYCETNKKKKKSNNFVIFFFLNLKFSFFIPLSDYNNLILLEVSIHLVLQLIMMHQQIQYTFLK